MKTLFLARSMQQNGVQLREFNDDVYDSFGEAAEEVLEEARDHSALSKKIYDSVIEKRAEIGKWSALSDVSYTIKRNRVLGL